MKPRSELMPASAYARVIRPLLPPEVFLPRQAHLWKVLLHLALVGAGYAMLRHSGLWWTSLVCSTFIGHSLGCLAFLAHDVSHHSVVSSRTGRRGLELLLWGLNVISPTLWRRIHNQTHHHETNTVKDPDRQFRKSEQSMLTQAYNRLLYPSHNTWHGNPLPLFHFVTYILRHLITALLPGRATLPIVTHKPEYAARHRMAILAELLVIVLLQWLIWLAVGQRWSAFVWASPVPILVASAVVMMYVFTNHFLNPLCEHTDPLIGSTSVIVPRWMDWLHDNFSYHTEHHLFPGMNPKWYPEVSRLLQQHFSERYNRLPLSEAWRRLWQRDEFIQETIPAPADSAECR